MPMTPLHSILVVEDDPDIRDVVGDVLALRGYRVTCAGHGLEALEILRATAEKPRLILLDLSMPVMDGWAFLAAQASDPSIDAIPVVVMTAVPTLTAPYPGTACTRTLRKPIALADLIHAIRDVCP